jgi:hypothetical protein
LITKPRILASIAAIILTVCEAAVCSGQEAVKTPSPVESHQRYTCLMHPEVITDKPGECPKCGMPLVPLKEKAPRAYQHIMAGQQDDEHGPAHEDQAGHSDHAMVMPSSVNLSDPMSRESSGTSWIPDSSPMYGRMWMLGQDTLMLHGGLFPRYVNASTSRGDDRIDAPNWLMAMYSHPVNDNIQLGARLMMSLDPLTEGGRGYPLLFQSGESWHGEPLHDRQHPHDLFDELAVSYSQKLTSDVSSYLYFGYPGEPALGPPTFMHRPSAMDDPDAPISHHWQDSTHITFGVATAGLQWKTVKIEGSIFTGREPNENRYNFDKPRFDSYSGRLSWNPTSNLALQISHGYIKSPEELEPDLKEHRTTASVIYNQPLGRDSNLATSFVWGQNDVTREGRSQSFLFETNYQRGANTIYGRWERVEKSGHELVLSGADVARVFPIAGYSIGYVHDFAHNRGIDIGLGAQFTLNDMPNRLERYYGTDLPYSFQFFVRVRPSRHDMSEAAVTGSTGK